MYKAKAGLDEVSNATFFRRSRAKGELAYGLWHM